MKKVLLPVFPLLLLIFTSCSNIKYTVEAPDKPQTKPAGSTKGLSERNGKCYKNCLVPDRYTSAWVRLPIYTGTEPDAPLRIETIMEEPPRNKWVKQHDGSITLEQIPPKMKAVRTLADTFFYRYFKYEKFESVILVEKGGFMRETQVICSDARTPNLLLQISMALKSYGYMEAPKTQWDAKFSQAIQQFQKDNSLPVGDLNLDTLQFLGI
jgi:hypothetical protein